MTTHHSVRRIESEDNRFFKQLEKMLTGRGIRKYDAALISGSKMVMDAMRTSPELCEAWIGAPKLPAPPPALPKRAAWYELSTRLFQRLDISGTGAPLLLIKAPPIPSWRPEEGFVRGCSVLVPFQDPENVGAVIRSAVAFGAARVILLAESAHPYHPKALRASGGTVFAATLVRGPSVNDLPATLPVVALSPEGRDIAGFEFPERFGLLPGVEGPGLPARFRERSVSIPMTGSVESLNAATAAAIALFLWSRSNAKR
jgi:16S rRNA (guanine527-N7)-methyltransferase